MDTATSDSECAAAVPDGAPAGLRRTCLRIGDHKALARRNGATRSRVWSWLVKSRAGAAGPFVTAIEAATGVPRHAPRPNICPASARSESHQENQEACDAGLP